MDSLSLFEQNESTRSAKAKRGGDFGLAKLLIVFGIGAAFLAMIVYALIMRDDIRHVNVDIPLISAPDTPVKVRPDQPGGMNFPNREKQVFNLLDESLMMETATMDDPTLATVDQNSEENVIENPTTIDEVALVQVPEEPTVVSQMKREPPLMEAPVPPQVLQGEYGVQLASFVNRADAEAALVVYAKDYANLLENLNGEVQSQDIGQGRGVRHRARFVGLESQNMASQLCRSLKQRNQGCLVVKR